MGLKGRIIEEQLGKRQLFIYVPPSYQITRKYFPVIYAHDGENLKELMASIMPNLEEGFKDGIYKEFILVAIYSKERIHEYTPWLAAALNERFEAFKGNGKTYLSFITNELKVHIDKHYRTLTEKEDTTIMGYSFGGLISIYAAFETTCFGKIVSISGSFWYENILSYMEEHKFANSDVKIYMSYGSREGSNKDNRQADTVQCAQIAGSLVKEKLVNKGELYVYTDDGEHHDYRIDRYQLALKWIAKK